MKAILYLLLFITFVSCQPQKKKYRDYINLEGTWQFALDSADQGIDEQWYLHDLNDAIVLPGTTDLNQKGFLNKDTTTMHLNRVYQYEGAAWYRKKIIIPEHFSDKHVQLFLERTKPSMVWIDSMLVGSSDLLQTPHRFDLSAYATPGEHYLTIRVDNSLSKTPYGNVHIYSDDTQTNWNGIIGKMNIEATEKTHITNLQVYPDVENRKIDIVMEVVNDLQYDDVTVTLFVERTVDGKTTELKAKEVTVPCAPVIKLNYELGDECMLWDEHRQPLYQLTAQLSDGDHGDAMTVPFGMRSFTAKGTQFQINGRNTFLRGKQEAAVFPLTGAVPTTVEEWVRVFEIAKAYGLNHYRYHSYCPPEAAFAAADQVGIYLQPELPFWRGLDSDSLADKLRQEGMAMLKEYTNHPSFVMFSHGNEIWGDQKRVEQNIAALKAYDSRPLYTTGSNNNIGYTPPGQQSDFFVGARTPSAGDTTATHIRLTHSFADSHDGGILNTQSPSTAINFSHVVSQFDLPLVSHEIGQYQIYPDFDEINKYTGVLRARNLEVFRRRLAKTGMGEMDSIFQQASGAWSALCYKAEMEAALRTPGFGGFQLLDLQDFPGQGTALVGVLDAFMDSKGVITAEEWRQSCHDVVVLLEFPKYCWATNETYSANVLVANYSDKSLSNGLAWQVQMQDGTVIQQGTFDDVVLNVGGLTEVGAISVDLSSVTTPEQLTVHVAIPDTEYANRYPLWVYTSPTPVEKSNNIKLSEQLDQQTLAHLEGGGNVLLFPKADDVKRVSIPGLFPPDFWNYGMFKGISERNNKPVSPGTLGLLTDPKHPMFSDFPTDFHTNWQWFSIIKESNALILDKMPHDYYPIVQVIDNVERNHKLGLIFECKTGTGKLLVCMSPLHRMMDKPEANQLYRSIVGYMMSEDFSPEQVLTRQELKALLGQ